MPERMLRLPDVKALSGQSRSTIYLRISQRLFPRPLLLGFRMVGWPESEVVALNAARIRGESDEEISALVLRLEAARKFAA
jgi:prophage regulatory protein